MEVILTTYDTWDDPPSNGGDTRLPRTLLVCRWLKMVEFLSEDNTHRPGDNRNLRVPTPRPPPMPRGNPPRNWIGMDRPYDQGLFINYWFPLIAGLVNHGGCFPKKPMSTKKKNTPFWN